MLHAKHGQYIQASVYKLMASGTYSSIFKYVIVKYLSESVIYIYIYIYIYHWLTQVFDNHWLTQVFDNYIFENVPEAINLYTDAWIYWPCFACSIFKYNIS